MVAQQTFNLLGLGSIPSGPTNPILRIYQMFIVKLLSVLGLVVALACLGISFYWGLAIAVIYIMIMSKGKK